MAPGFVQRPRPPFTLAAHGPRTMAVAARHADTWNTFGPSLDDGQRLSAELDAACVAIGRDPSTVRRSVLLGLTDGTAWTTRAELDDRVHTWHAAGFREVIFYDPPYARAGVPCAPPGAADEFLADLDRLRASLA